MDKEVNITQFKWACQFGPFKISCDQCNLTTVLLKNLIDNELKDINVKFEIKP